MSKTIPFVVIGLLLFGLLLIPLHKIATTYVSMDYNIYCKASALHSEGKNFFDVSELKEVTGHNFPFRYPTLSILMFQFFCNWSHYVVYSVLGLLCLVMFWLLIKKDFWLFTILMLTAFTAFSRNFMVGNIGIVDLFLFIIALGLFFKEKYYLSAIVFGVMGFFKTIPLVYGIIFLCLDTKFINKVKYGATIFFSWCFLHLVSFLIYPELSLSFYKLLFTGYPVLDAAVGFYSPTTLLFVQEFFKGQLGVIIYGLVCLTLIGLYLFTYKRFNLEVRVSLLVLLIMLCLPELKFYSYVMGILPVYYILRNLNWKQKWIGFTLVSGLPVLLFTWSIVTNDWFKDTILKIFFYYPQYLSLLIFYIIFVVVKNARLNNNNSDVK